MLDRDEVISRSASGLIKDFGDKAHVHAMDIADYLAVLGNNEGEALWRSIAKTIERCLRSSPHPSCGQVGDILSHLPQRFVA